jgi:hypothetical protein
MKHPQDKTQMTPCDSHLPELEVPPDRKRLKTAAASHKRYDGEVPPSVLRALSHQ